MGFSTWGSPCPCGREEFKTALRRDFGHLLGLPRVPAVQTLRTRLRRKRGPPLVMRKLVASRVQLEEITGGRFFGGPTFTFVVAAE